MTDAIRVGLVFEPWGSLPRPLSRRQVLWQTLSGSLACGGGAALLARSPRFTRPAAGGHLSSGRHEVHGVAWTIEGPHVLRTRAGDPNGQVQPESSPWDRSGSLWNGIDQITCEVG